MCFFEYLILQPFGPNPYCQIDTTRKDNAYIFPGEHGRKRGEGEYKMSQTKTPNWICMETLVADDEIASQGHKTGCKMCT